MIRLERTLNFHTDIPRLFIRQFSQVGVNTAQVQLRYFLVEVLGQ